MEFTLWVFENLEDALSANTGISYSSMSSLALTSFCNNFVFKQKLLLVCRLCKYYILK